MSDKKTVEQLQAELDLLHEQEAALAAKQAELEAAQAAEEEIVQPPEVTAAYHAELDGLIADLKPPYREHGREGVDSGERV